MRRNSTAPGKCLGHLVGRWRRSTPYHPSSSIACRIGCDEACPAASHGLNSDLVKREMRSLPRQANQHREKVQDRSAVTVTSGGGPDTAQIPRPCETKISRQRERSVRYSVSSPFIQQLMRQNRSSNMHCTESEWLLPARRFNGGFSF
ncbi:hypothetical protein N657DRAFT_212718 [Parathielavia appendiculata]|uniref:Uncharacterized protein n=1 Tax=Parathielavia appendiculata TaxID=2587402 RepID=A0AAN6Z708_9PEZI|nr:hypothetical protein N657DRAFT_212718 [Parathielavia appendiculata]